MHYLIDGYNWLFRLPKSKSSLENKRRFLLESLHDLTQNLSVPITIVFDASEPGRALSSQGYYKDIEIIYTTTSQNADEYILEFVEDSKAPHRIAVVTLDRDLGVKCKVRGAKVLSFDELLETLTKKKSKKKKQKSEILFQKALKESPVHFARLLALFEKKLLEDLPDDQEER